MDRKISGPPTVFDVRASPNACSSTFKELPVIKNFKSFINPSFIRITTTGKNNANKDPKGFQMFIDYIRVVKNATGGCQN